jgi:hypothetical protein
MIDRGHCESATPPALAKETTVSLSNATFARSVDHAHGGTYSYKATKTIAAGTGAIVFLTTNGTTTDFHGLIPGPLLSFACWLWIPSGGCLGTEIVLSIYDYLGTWGASIKAAANLYDQWQFLQQQCRLRAGCSGAHVRFDFAAAAEINEVFYVDDISLIMGG